MTATAQPIRADGGVAAAPVGDRGAHWRRRIAYVLLIGYALLMLVPFAWSVITSFKTLPDSVKLTIIPEPVHAGRLELRVDQAEAALPVLFLNSAIIAGVATLTNLVLGSIAGYAFARLKFPGREVLFLMVLATLMIPDQLRLVPIYVLFNNVWPDARNRAVHRR